MTHDEFIGHVQHRARLGSRGEAEQAVRATLETLSERLAGGAAGNLAAQLPSTIGQHLMQGHGGESFDIDEFFRRVSERQDVDLPKSVYHTRAVLEVLEEAVSEGQMDKIRDQLPEPFLMLMDSGSEGELELKRDDADLR